MNQTKGGKRAFKDNTKVLSLSNWKENINNNLETPMRQSMGGKW